MGRGDGLDEECERGAEPGDLPPPPAIQWGRVRFGRRTLAIQMIRGFRIGAPPAVIDLFPMIWNLLGFMP
jgi:hypothetical protein